MTHLNQLAIQQTTSIDRRSLSSKYFPHGGGGGGLPQITLKLYKGRPHHRGLRPLLFSKNVVGSLKVPKEQCCWTGPTVFRPYARKQECLTTCRCHNKGSTFSVILSPRPRFELTTPRSTAGALPTELSGRRF